MKYATLTVAFACFKHACAHGDTEIITGAAGFSLGVAFAFGAASFFTAEPDFVGPGLAAASFDSRLSSDLSLNMQEIITPRLSTNHT